MPTTATAAAHGGEAAVFVTPSLLAAPEAAAGGTPWYAYETLTITSTEYAEAERDLVRLESSPNQDDDAEFTAILKMKTEPLLLTEAEAETYASLRQRRARPVGQPLPLD